MAAIRALCTKALLLRGGQVAFFGPVDECLERYAVAAGSGGESWARPAAEAGAAGLTIERIAVTLEGEPPEQRLALEVLLQSRQSHRPAFLAIDIVSATGVPLMQALPTVRPFLEPSHRWHRAEIEVILPPLIPARYFATVWVGPHNTETLDLVERAVAFEVHVSPTPERTFPHTADHGYVVPATSFRYEPLQDAPAAVSPT